MSDEMSLSTWQTRFSVVSLTFGILIGVVAFVQAWVLQPYRMDNVEKRVQSIELKREEDKYLLIKLDERFLTINNRLLSLESKLDALSRRLGGPRVQP